MADRIRAGIVGVGFMGTVHARAVRRNGGVVSRICGSTPESSRAGAERIGAEFAASSVDELLAADDVDVVHVCTPNATHATLVRAAIAAGKHVVCEKPLAVDATEAAELVALAAEAGVTATVPFVYRFYPTVREARSRVADGTAGPVRLLHGSYLQDWLAEDTDDNWRVDTTAGGASRAFADIGVHWCDLVEFVSGHRIARLTASTVTTVPERGGRPVTTEDAAVVLFETDRGATGTLTVSQVSQGRKNRLEFSVDAASESLAFDQENPDSLWIGGRDVNRQLMRGAGGGQAAARYSVVPAGHPQGYQDCFDAFVADTYAALAGEDPDGLPTFADGLRAARITEAVLESARTRSWVPVA
ncbi:gfo/Idh/MocA family oxidoreductase [Modestobacter sp. I12A-02628]|uniref:Gfo/Idh/MocA family oxidoreductase n=1 Tax=Goekera deserti TaxID=2497753 RepID=A0A7K3WE87_9ACTN|nr:Gfo/Idh/MocA family oxidoreductase [Goekera deserti]MPQ99729.1 gfo/Idh/MocA family oxidoreductase [Goekera deserti]NDI46260.1 Gfo/Idh/MocA family oxidoreductase [Goekera deserti]NEL54808.1 Gfo/Idh/MocA family oxidoreductase [Goekera deserti]